MLTAGAPWLTLGGRLVCLPGTTEIKIRTNTGTNTLFMPNTYSYCDAFRSCPIVSSGEKKLCTHMHKPYSHMHKENAHCLI